ncbi:MAG TPA: tetratricopeptide repeat protein [Blastocatellia bacterium]|nr:tetratricopeptide repeat protein [Blastocatellia bacterium]
MRLLLLALLCVLPAFGQTPDNALTETRALLNQGKAKEAIAKLQTLPTDARTQQLLGVAYFRANDYVKAIETLTPIYAALPKDSAERKETVQSLGMAHYVLGHLAEAVPFLEQTLAWSPNSNELNYALGMASIQTRQEAKGRAAFARMFRVAPDSPAAHFFAAQMMIRVELNEQAEAELKQALAKNSKLPQANFLLGVIAIQLSKFDEAVALLEKEIELNPGNAMAFYRLGDVYTRQLKWDDAIPALQKSVWLNPYFSGPYILLGKSYLKKRDLGNAEGMLRRAIQMDPNNKSAHYMLAQLLQQTGRTDEAKREFAIAEKLQGSNDQPEK